MSLDPYAREEVSARHYLHALNPLAKIVAVLPVMVVIVFTRDVLTPLVLVGLAYLVLLTGVRLTRRRAAILFLALPLLGGILSLGFGLWTDPARVDHSVSCSASADTGSTPTRGAWGSRRRCGLSRS